MTITIHAKSTIHVCIIVLNVAETPKKDKHLISINWKVKKECIYLFYVK